jgi:hypothetical protein
MKEISSLRAELVERVCGLWNSPPSKLDSDWSVPFSKSGSLYLSDQIALLRLQAVLSSDSYLRIYECIELHNLANWHLAFDIDINLSHPSASPPVSSSEVQVFGASNGKGHGSGGAAAGKPGRREADGGWGISWCKDTTWGQLIAIAAGTTGVIKVCLLFSFEYTSIHSRDLSSDLATL